MRKNIFTAGFLGLSMLLAACSGEGDVPAALAFQDTETVNRPVGNPCASNEFSVVFDESVVLEDSDTDTLGPFDIALPAGTYDVLVSSWLGAQEDPLQTDEQWFFTTDSGYTSPTTTDSSPELLLNQSFTAQNIAEATSVMLHHKAPGSEISNSVHPLCVGFREVEVEEAISAAGTNDSIVPVEAVQVSFAVEAADETTPLAPADGQAGADEVVTELALTGPGDLAVSLTLTGAALILAGSAATVATRRSEDA